METRMHPVQIKRALQQSGTALKSLDAANLQHPMRTRRVVLLAHLQHVSLKACGGAHSDAKGAAI